MATKTTGKSSAEATVTQPAGLGRGKIKTETQKQAHQTTTDTPETPKAAKQQAETARSAANAGVTPPTIRERGAADDSVAASETQESRVVPAESPETTPATEVEQRRRDRREGPDRGASFGQLAEATLYTDLVELANTLNSAVVTFELRTTPVPGFEPLRLPRGTKGVLNRLHELVKDVRGLINAPEEQHKHQKKDRIERDIVE